MIDHKKLVLFFSISVVLLFLRDTPYLNVLIIEKLWLIYLLLLFWIFSNFIPKRTGIFFFAAVVLFLIALIFSLLKIEIVAEAIGIVIYVLLWLIVLQKIVYLVRSEKHNNR
ncbi:MAG: hypothetical protein ACD_50C00116G0007 [uncultured bacterium]|nr:MAG: hypothetical protein ACD_50C00116G0007 [uncultured bacterium]OGH14350.1 MAG: hypothetical protein A2687_01850 [Candidatus Levybacteria bacterium RIFCSPHIGHO2_01_FULL_38_26]